MLYCCLNPYRSLSIRKQRNVLRRASECVGPGSSASEKTCWLLQPPIALVEDLCFTRGS